MELHARNWRNRPICFTHPPFLPPLFASVQLPRQQVSPARILNVTLLSAAQKRQVKDHKRRNQLGDKLPTFVQQRQSTHKVALSDSFGSSLHLAPWLHCNLPITSPMLSFLLFSLNRYLGGTVMIHSGVSVKGPLRAGAHRCACGCFWLWDMNFAYCVFWAGVQMGKCVDQ